MSETTVVSGRQVNKRRIAAGVGALMLGVGVLGGSYALWSDSASLDGVELTSGVLDVAPVDGTGSTWDISTNQPANQALTPAPLSAIDGHELRGGHTVVPGDTVQLERSFAVAMKGDNLYADLSLTNGDDAAGGLLAELIEGRQSGVNFTYDVYVDGVKDNALSGKKMDEASTLRFVSADSLHDGAAPEGAIVVEKDTELSTNADGAFEGEADIAVVVNAHFEETTNGREKQEVAASIASATVSLNQVAPTA